MRRRDNFDAIERPEPRARVTLDSFEFASLKLALQCGCMVIGHGIESDSRLVLSKPRASREESGA